ncbi:MAG TPA: hypothetical protein VG650_14820 [Mycobacteriales bacterium]|nr:hypothetical protein [Mycobacteriales bacterium]
MSGLLAPVGPLPPRVYWVRRIVVLAVPLILIIVIAVSCSGGGAKPSGAGPGPTSSTSTSTTPAAAGSACLPGDLAATLHSSALIYPLGQSPAFSATITNVSASSCEFTSSPANEIWTVVSGPATYWTTAATAGCQVSDASSTKTLAPNATTQLTITWDGKRQEPGCKSGDAAPAGTYHLHARLDGVKAKQVIFHFHSNTQ